MSGVGRGRGWLQIKQNTQDQTVNHRPGSPSEVKSPEDTTPKISNEIQNDNTTSSHQEANIKAENIYADPIFVEDVSELISRLKHFNFQDDGILFNQKLRYVLDYLKENCANSDEFDKTFYSMYTSCLNNSELIPKLALLVTVPSIFKTEVHGRKLTKLFLQHLQFDFERAEELQRTNKPLFRNIIQMLGEFHSKKQFRPIKLALLMGLEMLLDSAQPLDLNLFAKQIYLNASTLELTGSSSLMVKLKKILITRKDLSSDTIARLLLSQDIVTNKSSLLSSDLIQLYRSVLGDEEMSTFQGPMEMLSVETNQVSKTLDAYQSKVNVLQVSSPSSSDNSPSPANSSSNGNNNKKVTKVSVETPQNMGRWDTAVSQAAPKAQEKHGRPILGIGARLNKKGINDRLKTQPRVQEGQHSGISGMTENNKGKSNKSMKGWEHDDRFENDYS